MYLEKWTEFITWCLLCLPAFMAEFHKMAGVINGVAQCFAMEDQECEWEGLWGRGRGEGHLE